MDESNLEKIKRFRTFQKGWDSYSGDPINTTILDRLPIILEGLKTLGFPEPSLVPMSDGGISLEWYKGESELAIEWSPKEEPAAFLVHENVYLEKLVG